MVTLKTATEPTQNEAHRKRKIDLKNAESISEICDNFQQPNLPVIKVPKEETEPEDTKIFGEIMAKNFPNSMNAMNPQIQLDQWTPNTRNMNKTTSRHILIKLLRINYKILKAEKLQKNKGKDDTDFLS